MKNSTQNEDKSLIRKAWDFIWKDDSLLSWIVSLALAFIFVKFILFPLLSLVFATSLPLVVVESGSMHHPGSFVGNAIGLQDSFEIWWDKESNWYTQKDIEKSEAETWPLNTGLEMGDIVFVSGHDEELEIGDVIVFNADKQYPLIHRIVEIKDVNGKTYYETKGDNNSGQLADELNISEDAIVGKAVLKVPKLGWLKLGLVKLIEKF